MEINQSYERLENLMREHDKLFAVVYPKHDSKLPKLFKESDPQVIEYKLICEEIDLVKNDIKYFHNRIEILNNITKLAQPLLEE